MAATAITRVRSREKGQMDEKTGAFFNYVNLQTLRLKPDDVQRAVEVFERKFGQRPRALGLHEDYDLQVKTAAEEMGIMLYHPPGMLAHEIWLSPSEGFVTRSSYISSLQLQIGEGRNEIQTRSLIPVGRPPMGLPMQKLLELRNQGLGSRDIAKNLREEGLKVSHMAVYRALKKMNEGKK